MELVLVIVALLLVILALYLRGLAGRLDRLHLRVDVCGAALDARLERRSSLAQEIAIAGLLDPASSVLLLNAATTARHAGEQRDVAESDLSAALRAVFPDAETVEEIAEDPEARELLTALGESCTGVVLARRFSNDAVRAAIAVRRRWIVRMLRLAGHARWPSNRDMDDAPPEALTALALDAA
ncbi:MAG TPA: hypothetical protein VFX15_09745 [Actinomycetes bacterium]|nr:hypothetical protein [Actinomycetes bacterium]